MGAWVWLDEPEEEEGLPKVTRARGGYASTETLSLVKWGSLMPT